MKSKLLLIGSGSIHTYNYYKLIEGYFDEILMLTDNIREEFKSINPIKADFSIHNPIKAYQNYLFLKKKIKEYRPDMIHVHQANSTSYLTLKAAKKTGIPVIVTAWGSDVLITPEQSKLINRMVIYNLKNADYLTADSKNVVDKIIERVGKTKNEILVANFGVADFYKKVPKENIIYSNRLHNKLYRIDEVIRAFARFMEKNNENWKLVIAGEGSETEKLKALSADLKISKTVEFVGWLNKDENYNYYNKAKIFVSIPESDATAISLLEAMFAGCFPVVSDLPANKEWIKDGENGIIVKDLNGDFLQKASKIDMQRATKVNQALIHQHGTKEINRKKFIDLYQKALTKK
jgi:glycosyltransferase involved in cell wall biosynthesis